MNKLNIKPNELVKKKSQNATIIKETRPYNRSNNNL